MVFIYPEARRDDSVVDVLHGHSIADPYRWLEDPDSEETANWVGKQNELTQGYLSQCQHIRDTLRDELKKSLNYARWSCPRVRGTNYFFSKNDGLQNQSVCYVARGSLHAEPEVVIDPNQLSEDGTKSLGTTSYSESGKLLAYLVSASGSDWMTGFVMDTETKQVLSDKVEWCKFTDLEWTHDEKGFFYSRFPAPVSLHSKDEEARGKEVDSSLNSKVYYHVLGTDQSEDKLVFETPEQPKWRTSATVSDDGKYVIFTVHEGCDPVNHFYVAEIENLNEKLKEGPLKPIKIVESMESGYNYITNEGRVFYVRTNKNAPRYKIAQIDLDNLEAGWVDLIPEGDNDDVLEDAAVGRSDLLIIQYLSNVSHHFKIYDLKTGTFNRRLDGPTIGTFSGFTCRKQTNQLFYHFTSFVVPALINKVDLDTFEVSKFQESVACGHNPEDYETTQVGYKSKDGTVVPMTIVYRKGRALDGTAPTRLYGYGGFNISILPSFNSNSLTFVKMFDGVMAVPNIRGGGEFGDKWHQAGTLDRKQNVFDDFIAAAEYLIAEKYTSTERLFIVGGSNGGLLTAACGLQRPDLFKCCVANVGVLDMLRFHKFTIGHCWTTDYGCADNDKDFEYLIKYSPYHNIRAPKEGQYPAFLLTTADHDDRVVPCHSFKFMAMLQHVMGKHPGQTNPLMIRVDVKAGHGAGKPISKVIDEVADTYAYVAATMGLTIKK